MKRILFVLGLATVLGGCGEPTLLERAEQGDAESQYSMGVHYHNRGLLEAWTEGITPLAAEAAEWFRKAAKQGHAKAQFSLGQAYSGGYGVAKDEAMAVKWYRKAAAQGVE